MAKTTKRTCNLLKQALTLVFAVLIISCKTIQPSTEIVHVHDTIKVTKVEKEIAHDSVFQDRLIYIKGDTVVIKEKVKEVQYRDKEVHDTLIQFRDSLVYVPVEVEVVKTKVDWGWTALGWSLFILLLLYLIKRRMHKTP